MIYIDTHLDCDHTVFIRISDSLEESFPKPDTLAFCHHCNSPKKVVSTGDTPFTYDGDPNVPYNEAPIKPIADDEEAIESSNGTIGNFNFFDP